MTFTTNFFLFCLFPFFVLFYYLLRNKMGARKVLLLVANTVFYLFGGITGFSVVCFICLLTWLLCKILVNHNKILLVIGCIILLIPLLTCKYLNFSISNINSIFNTEIAISNIIVPVGVSFFTFEALSLVIDVYNGKVEKVKMIDIYVYLTFFPTVTAGPIYKYVDFIKGEGSTLTAEAFGGYVERFVIGLGKKVLIAGNCSVSPIADCILCKT